jgi:hypothetical protein
MFFKVEGGQQFISESASGSVDPTTAAGGDQ